jgi:hypothetical protein
MELKLFYLKNGKKLPTNITCFLFFHFIKKNGQAAKIRYNKKTPH